MPASEGESATAHFFLGAGDEGLGTRGIGMRTEESDGELLEDEEDEVVRLEKIMSLGVGTPVIELRFHWMETPLFSFQMHKLLVISSPSPD